MDVQNAWRDQVRSRAASRDSADRLIRLVERLQSEFGVEPRAADGARRDYLSLLPRGRTRGRVGAITIGSGRFYAMFTPDRVGVHHAAMPETQVAEIKYLTRYVNTDADMEIAVRLLGRALADRGL